MKIAFYKGDNILDDLVIFFSRGGYSHCCVVLNDGSIIEAKPFTSVRWCKSMTEKLECNSKIDIFEVVTNSEQDKIIEDFLKKQLGKKYDYLSVIGFVLYDTNEGRKKYGKWFCSELVFAAFQKAGIDLLKRIDAWKVSPTILSYNNVMTLSDSISFRYQQQ